MKYAAAMKSKRSNRADNENITKNNVKKGEKCCMLACVYIYIWEYTQKTST